MSETLQPPDIHRSNFSSKRVAQLETAMTVRTLMNDTSSRNKLGIRLLQEFYHLSHDTAAEAEQLWQESVSVRYWRDQRESLFRYYEIIRESGFTYDPGIVANLELAARVVPWENAEGRILAVSTKFGEIYERTPDEFDPAIRSRYNAFWSFGEKVEAFDKQLYKDPNVTRRDVLYEASYPLENNLAVSYEILRLVLRNQANTL